MADPESLGKDFTARMQQAAARLSQSLFVFSIEESVLFWVVSWHSVGVCLEVWNNFDLWGGQGRGISTYLHTLVS